MLITLECFGDPRRLNGRLATVRENSNVELARCEHSYVISET
jgi:hypothetical protein